MLARVTVEITGDASNAVKAIDSVDKKTAGMKGRVMGSLKTLAAGFAAGFSAQAIVKGIGSSITAASDLSETISKTEQVFGDASKGVLDWSTNSATALGQSRQEALDAASTFAIFGKASGLSGQELNTFSTDLVGLSADFASFANVKPEEAVSAIGAALRGETEPMRKFGLVIDQASIQAKAFEMGLIATAKTPVDSTKKALVVGEMVKAFADGQKITGDFARTSDGLANQQRILSAQLTGVSVAVGNVLLPAVVTIMGAVLNAAGAFGTMAGFVRDNIGVIGPLAAVVAVAAVALNTAAIAGRAHALATTVVSAATRVYAIAQGVLNAVLSANPIALVVIAIAALVAGIVIAYQRSQTFRAILQGVWSTVSGAVRTAVTAITAAVASMTTFIAAVPGKVRGALATVAGIIRAPFQAGWDFVRNSVVGPLSRGFSGVAGAVRGALGGVRDAITAPFSAAWSWVQSNVIGPMRGVWNGIAGTVNRVSFRVAVPDWVPVVGGKSWSFDPPSLPMLARGAYLDRPTLAVVGEGRHGEFVTPEPMLRRLIRSELAAAAAPITITVNGALDPVAVAGQIQDLLTAHARRRGGVTIGTAW